MQVRRRCCCLPRAPAAPAAGAALHPAARLACRWAWARAAPPWCVASHGCTETWSWSWRGSRGRRTACCSQQVRKAGRPRAGAGMPAPPERTCRCYLPGRSLAEVRGALHGGAMDSPPLPGNCAADACAPRRWQHGTISAAQRRQHPFGQLGCFCRVCRQCGSRVRPLLSTRRAHILGPAQPRLHHRWHQAGGQGGRCGARVPPQRHAAPGAAAAQLPARCARQRLPPPPPPLLARVAGRQHGRNCGSDGVRRCHGCSRCHDLQGCPPPPPPRAPWPCGCTLPQARATAGNQRSPVRRRPRVGGHRLPVQHGRRPC
jgi:hypothetical protein